MLTRNWPDRDLLLRGKEVRREGRRRTRSNEEGEWLSGGSGWNRWWKQGMWAVWRGWWWWLWTWALADQRLSNGPGNRLELQRVRVYAGRRSTTAVAEPTIWRGRPGFMRRRGDELMEGSWAEEWQVCFIQEGESRGMFHTHNTKTQRLTRRKWKEDTRMRMRMGGKTWRIDWVVTTIVTKAEKYWSRWF